jgi:hypothetical protein
VDEALARGDYVGLSNRAALLLRAVGGLLGVGTLLVIVLHPT